MEGTITAQHHASYQCRMCVFLFASVQVQCAYVCHDCVSSFDAHATNGSPCESMQMLEYVFLQMHLCRLIKPRNCLSGSDCLTKPIIRNIRSLNERNPQQSIWKLRCII